MHPKAVHNVHLVLRKALEHARGARLYALWRTAATTGMRRGELLDLRTTGACGEPRCAPPSVDAPGSPPFDGWPNRV